MKRFRTLRIRFALWTGGLLLLVLALFGTFVYISMWQGLSSSVDDSLRLSSSQAIAAVNIENGQINFSDSLPESNTTVDLQNRGFTIRILTPDGKILQSVGPYRDLPVSTLNVQKANMGGASLNTVSTVGSDPVRIYTAPIIDNQHLLGVIQVMQSLSSLTKTLNSLLLALLVSIPILLLITMVSGYFLAARALSPIDHITRTAQRISTEDLSARLNLPATDDEIGRLSRTIDNMLTRLEEGFNRERQFTSDASHELRTPLTAMQAILNVTREKQRPPKEYEIALDDLSEETDRLRSLTEDLLYMARGDAQPALLNETVNLSDLLIDVSESLLPSAESKRLKMDRNVAAELYIQGDSDALIRVCVNLIDNAIKYTDQGGIKVEAKLKNKREIEVTISDTGRGISEEHLPHIFERFYRVDGSRTTRGYGLGLAIVQEIVHNHQGNIEVSSQVGIGTEFRLHFPVKGKHFLNKGTKDEIQ